MEAPIEVDYQSAVPFRKRSSYAGEREPRGTINVILNLEPILDEIVLHQPGDRGIHVPKIDSDAALAKLSWTGVGVAPTALFAAATNSEYRSCAIPTAS